MLVDRLWPRGLRKEKAAVTLWLKDIAPSTELREWRREGRRGRPFFGSFNYFLAVKE